MDSTVTSQQVSLIPRCAGLGTFCVVSILFQCSCRVSFEGFGFRQQSKDHRCKPPLFTLVVPGPSQGEPDGCRYDECKGTRRLKSDPKPSGFNGQWSHSRWKDGRMEAFCITCSSMFDCLNIAVCDKLHP